MTCKGTKVKRSRELVSASVILLVAISILPAQLRAQEWPDVFDPFQLLTLNAEMDSLDWETVQNDTTFEIELPAMFWADGEDTILVSIRRKSSDPLDGSPDFLKVSLKIDFNEYVTGQSWHGLKKLSLENGDDQDVITEGLAWYVHRLASGPEGYGYTYPAAYASWVKLYINGYYTGVYASVEQRDKRLLENRGLWVEGETWLYKCETGISVLQEGLGHSPTFYDLCYDPFIQIEPPCATPSPDSLASVLPELIDMQAMLTMAAVDAFVQNPDALFNHSQNAFFVDFLGGAKRMYFPWDLDSVLAKKETGCYPSDDAYADTLLAVPEFRDQYTAIMYDLVTGPLAGPDVVAFLDSVQVLLTEALEADPNNQLGGETVETRCDELRSWASGRPTQVLGCLEAVCQVSPTDLDFGTVAIGDSLDKTFTIKNIGSGTLTGSVTEACDHYGIASGGGAYSLGADDSVVVTVRFKPTAAGTHLCTIDTDTECSDVSCTGVGELPPACEVVPTSLDFGTVTTGEADTLSFTLTNTGGGTLSGTVTEACAHYAIVAGGGAYSLGAGEYVQVDVEFAPTAAGTHLCTIDTDTECADVSCTGVGELPPACEVVPTSLDFGTVTTGEADTMSFTLTNTGGGTLSGTVTEACAHYAIVAGGGAYSLGAGEYVQVDVEFAPTAAGTHLCTIDTDTECADVSCTGVGESPPACFVLPTSLNFGTLTVGEADTMRFMIINTGGGTLSGTVSEACDHYAIIAGGGAYSLGGGQLVYVYVEFAPTAGGTHLCTIETGQALCSDVACTGVGELPPACEVAPLSLDFGTVTVGEADTMSFTITNTGGGTMTGTVTDTSAHYELVAGGGAYSLGAGEYVQVDVEFAPLAAGTHTCRIETGQALCRDVSCTGVGELPPTCEVVPTSLDFGTVITGEADTLSFTITNTGGGTLSGSVSEACSHYAIVAGGGAYSLGVGEYVQVDVEFAPTAGGTLMCTIDTDTECSDVSCTGVGDDISGVDDRKPAIPGAFRLAQNSPNPFSSGTDIRYELPVDCHVRLQVYNVLGKKMATLVDQYQAAGCRVVHWNSRNEDGIELPDGVYLYRLESGGYVEIKKMVFMK